MTRYSLPYLPWLHNTDRIISIYVVPPKVAKASTIVTVVCSCRWCCLLKNIANVNTALTGPQLGRGFNFWSSCVNGTMMLSITTFSIMTLSITTFSIMTLSIKGLYASLSILDTKHHYAACLYAVSHFIHFYAECHYAECCYAECRVYTMHYCSFNAELPDLKVKTRPKQLLCCLPLDAP